MEMKPLSAYPSNVRVLRVDHRREQGVVLAVALMFLLILTILGITAMSNANIEILLGSNYQAQMKTLADSENALSVAEDAVPSTPPKKNKPESALYIQSQPIGNPAYWSNTNTRVIEDDSTQTRYSIVYQGAGVIRKSGASAASTQSYSDTSGNQLIELYEVTVRGAGVRNSQRVIQSIYGTP